MKQTIDKDNIKTHLKIKEENKDSLGSSDISSESYENCSDFEDELDKEPSLDCALKYNIELMKKRQVFNLYFIGNHIFKTIFVGI